LINFFNHDKSMIKKNWPSCSPSNEHCENIKVTTVIYKLKRSSRNIWQQSVKALPKKQ